MATEDVIKASQSHLLAIGEGIRKRFLDGETWGNCAIEADRLWHAATRFQTESLKLRTITKDQRNAAEDNALALLELRHQALAMPSGVIIPTEERINVANALVAPYYRLAEVGSPILYRQADIQNFFKDLSNAPGAGAAWALRQLLAAMGLPEWALPVLGVITVAGVGLFAYNSFLAPVGGQVKLLRKAGSRGAGLF